MDIKGLAIWGLLGAFAYAAPRLLVALTSENRKFSAIGEALVAHGIGSAGAAAFTQFLANTFHQTSEADLRAIAFVLGMIANPVAPGIIHLVGTSVIRRFGGTSLTERP
jgi:hypothetical protein